MKLMFYLWKITSWTKKKLLTNLTKILKNRIKTD